jgi:glycosyltransferase involved in cell wall biosynthesis
MMDPQETALLVSVITPTYNHERFIARCIDSVLAQTYTNWEMIVLDDGSTDQTASIAGEYAKTDKRIRVIRQSNIGIFRLAETYNKALELANGEWIAILEGDDTWFERKLEIQVDVMKQKKDVALCWGQAVTTGSDNLEIIRTYPPLDSPDSKWFSNNPPGSILHVFLFRNCIPALTMMIRKEALLKTGGFQQSCGLPLVDLPTLYELAFQGKFLFIPQSLGAWRNYPTQITKIHTAAMMEGCKCLAAAYFKKPEVVAAAGKNLSMRTINKYYDGQLVISYSRSGRYKLIRKEFKSARKDYLRSIFRYGLNKPVWKIRSITGYLFSLFHLDVEGLSRLLGKTTYS